MLSRKSAGPGIGGYLKGQGNFGKVAIAAVVAGTLMSIWDKLSKQFKADSPANPEVDARKLNNLQAMADRLMRGESDVRDFMHGGDQSSGAMDVTLSPVPRTSRSPRTQRGEVR